MMDITKLFSLQGRVALITGGSKNLGKHIAEGFIAQGAKGYITSRKADSCNETAAELGPNCIPLPMDVSSVEGCKALAAAFAEREEKLDILVNNAGVFEENPLTSDEPDWLSGWERTMQINLTSSALLCRRAVLHWQDRKAEGRIINIASRAAYRGDSPKHWHYAASKAGMVAMTKSIARAYAAQDILAYAICPGFTMTGMADDYLASRGGDKLLADIPLGRVAMPEEVAEMVAFCALKAPPSMTGAVLDVNGASYVR